MFQGDRNSYSITLTVLLLHNSITQLFPVNMSQCFSIGNKPGTSKVGAIPKAQKARSLKLQKRGPFGSFETPVCWKIKKKLNDIFEQCHNAEKCKRGPSGIS